MIDDHYCPRCRAPAREGGGYWCKHPAPGTRGFRSSTQRLRKKQRAYVARRYRRQDQQLPPGRPHHLEPRLGTCGACGHRGVTTKHDAEPYCGPCVVMLGWAGLLPTITVERPARDFWFALSAYLISEGAQVPHGVSRYESNPTESDDEPTRDDEGDDGAPVPEGLGTGAGLGADAEELPEASPGGHRGVRALRARSDVDL